MSKSDKIILAAVVIIALAGGIYWLITRQKNSIYAHASGSVNAATGPHRTPLEDNPAVAYVDPLTGIVIYQDDIEQSLPDELNTWTFLNYA